MARALWMKDPKHPKWGRIVLEARRRLALHGRVVVTALAGLGLPGAPGRQLSRMTARGECVRLFRSNVYVRPDLAAKILECFK